MVAEFDGEDVIALGEVVADGDGGFDFPDELLGAFGEGEEFVLGDVDAVVEATEGVVDDDEGEDGEGNQDEEGGFSDHGRNNE